MNAGSHELEDDVVKGWYGLGSKGRSENMTRWIVIGLAALLGAWMTFDGSRALIVGDYVTPSSGPYAGQLGPWAKLVQKVGLDPRGTPVKVAMALIGAAWLIATMGALLSAEWAGAALVVIAAASLWYLPFGTLIAMVEILLLLLLRPL